MSLIFEALRKLEREKQAPERGILVVGPSTWAGGGATRVRLGLVAVVALGLVGLGVLIGTLLRRPAPPAAAPATPAPGAAAAALGTAPIAPAEAPPALGTAAAPPRPPVRPAGAPTPGAAPTATPPPPGGQHLTLQAVTEQDGIPVALINDRLLREGDAFDGVKVLRIAPGEVEVEIEATGERRMLRF